MAKPIRDDSGRFAKDLSNQARLIKEIEQTQSRINALKANLIEGDKEQEKLIKSQNAYLNKLLKISKQNTAEIKKQTESFDAMDDAMVSIGNRLKNNSKLAEITRDKFEATKDISKAITKELANGGVKTNKSKQEVIKALDAYKKSQISIAQSNKDKALGNITERERLQAVNAANDAFQTQLSLVDKTQITSKELLDLLDGMGKEAEDFASGIQKAKINSESMDRVFDSFSGIPAMGELNTLLKTNIKDTLAFKAAVFALGAALGKAAMDYFGAPIKTAIEQEKQRSQNRIDTEANIGKLAVEAQSIPKQIEQERLENRVNTEGEIAKMQYEAAYAGQKAAIQFSSQMQMGAAQFERAAKTALFGNKIGSVGYGAAQLQLAGISADKIASSMEAASSATGRMPSAKVGADMAIMAERTGQSVDSIASINEMFQRMDGVSESTAMNLSEGLRNMADQAKIGLGGLMREIADASKDALSYQIKSGPALAKQVAYAQSLGVSFGDIAKAGKSMVMNYKDSIKQEMQLSAMLGKNVDLSEVRAKFASGDTEGALKSLQAQGLDPAQMDMFAQDALSQALGGMDLSSLQKVATKQGAQVGGLKEGKAGAANQDFLSRTQAAESTLNSTQASISAETAILDAQLSAKIADSYLGSNEYKTLKENQNKAAQEAAKLAGAMNDAWIKSDAFAKQMTESTKLGFVSGLLENIVSGIAMLLGGTILSKVMGGGGFMKAIGGMIPSFGGAGAAAAGAPSMGGGGAPSMPGAGGPGGAPSMPGGGGAPGGAPGKAPGGGFTKGLVDSVKGVSTVLKSIITELGAVLKSGVDVVMQLANKLASGVMTTFNTIMSGLSKASSTMPTILGNLGKAIGSFFSGMGSGLVTFAQMMATPTALFGLPVGLIVMAMMMGLAAAMRIAAPAIEAMTPLILGLVSILGDTFVRALEAAGPIITSIFEGIGLIIEKVGNSISVVINSITDSISRLGGLNPVQLLAVAGGIASMAGALALFGGGSILGAIGSFFGGSVFDDLKDISAYAAPIMATALAVDALASAFSRLSGIDVSALSKIPWEDMEDFASEGGKFILASSGGGTFALSKQSTDNLEKMATNTEAMVKLNNTIAKLIKEGFFGGETTGQMKLYIDGKDVSTSMTRYKSNTQNSNP